MKARAAIVLAAFCLLVALLPARAEDQQDKVACVMDAQTFCAKFIPDRVSVAHCLMSNSSRISPACRAAIKHFK